MTRSSERGIAMILALFMVLILSVVGSSLMFVSQTETWASTNYRLASQSRYGAESGLHVATNHLLYTYAPPGTPGDPLAAYDLTVSPVTFNGQPVVLSSDPDVPSNYPVAATVDAFADAAAGTLDVTNGTVSYSTRATLRSMRQITGSYSGAATTIQSWEIVATGNVASARDSIVEVSATIERQVIPSFAYAAFATASGCAALSFAGGATTDSYDSGVPVVAPATPATTNGGGNVGTNGNLTEVGNTTTVNGTLSTPRSGVGNCTANNVTAQTVNGNGASVTGGLVELSQPVAYETPAPPDPLPPTSNQSFTQAGGCPAGTLHCAASADGATITPPSAAATVTLGNMSLQGNAILHLNAGTYVVNSLAMAGNARIVIDSGPVVFQVAGVGVATPIQIAGNGISNTTYDPTQLQFVYAGTGNISLTGGAETSALVYAPNATGSFAGGSDFYGAVIVNRLTATGGTTIHYDRRLQTSAMTPGTFMMSGFSWKAF